MTLQRETPSRQDCGEASAGVRLEVVKSKLDPSSLAVEMGVWGKPCSLRSSKAANSGFRFASLSRRRPRPGPRDPPGLEEARTGRTPLEATLRAPKAQAQGTG